jgi:hypothetical protein
MDAQLQGSHRATYDAIFQHPVARNLIWRDVRSMLDALSGVRQEEHDGTLKVMRNGRKVVLHCPVRKDFTDVRELMDLRRFLAESDGSSATLTPPIGSQGTHLLVVIDHRVARIYKSELRGTVPERLIPYDRDGHGRHLHHVEDHGNGQRKPEDPGFYETVAATLRGAEQILLFGSGTGSASAMDQLCAALAHHHADLAKRVVGSIVVDEHHLTEDQLLAQARAFYEGLEMHETRALC